MPEKRLFTYWDQGLETAPTVVRGCVARMRQLHPDWEVRVLDRASAAPYVADIPLPREQWRRLCMPHQSDLLRTLLLVRYGGVWADPTCFLSEPLDERVMPWAAPGLFLFTEPRPGGDRLISNWFIAADRGCPVLEAQLEALCDYWTTTRYRNLEPQPGPGVRWAERWLKKLLNRNSQTARLWTRRAFARTVRIAPYMIYHYQFCDLVRSRPELRARWAGAGKVPARDAIRLLRHGLLAPMTAEVRDWIDEPLSPVYKLTWKLDSPEIPAGSVLAYLLAKVERSRTV